MPESTLSRKVLIAGKPPENIIFLQPGTAAMAVCLISLNHSRFVRRRDYLDRTHTEDFESLLFLDAPQLLVTNSFGANLERVHELMCEWRHINPQLVVVLVTHAHGMDSRRFDRVISKRSDSWIQDLPVALEDFLSGKLRHFPS